MNKLTDRQKELIHKMVQKAFCLHSETELLMRTAKYELHVCKKCGVVVAKGG